MIRRTLTILGLTVAALLIAAALIMRPDVMIQTASGATSHLVCSKTFITGLAPEVAYAQNMRPEPGMGLIDWALRYDVDQAARRVTTTVFGMFKSSAKFYDGYGCRLEFAGDVPLDTPPQPATDITASLPEIAGPEVVVSTNPALTSALDKAFAQRPNGPPRWPHAIVVVHDGRVIAERYAPGIGVDTPLLSHSMAKSVINALVGILSGQQKLKVGDAVPAPAWQGNVTIDQLLRMDSGLPLDEGMGPGLAQRMWFTAQDNAAFAERTPLTTKPGTQWAYGNLAYAVLSRIVRDAAGKSPQSIAQFADRELFAPLGIRTATLEFDGAGSPMGGNSFFASARDWARFGLLYLNDGMAGDRRILPEGWVAYSKRQTLDAGYGAGFWLNTTNGVFPPWGRPWGMPGAPKDAYFARGYLGQFIVIVPSKNLVVVRMGVDTKTAGGIEDVGELVHDVIAALHNN
ncbi:MAG: serine hydrolase [Alphaproteobacteria bacterium]|nr:serine hydrolase [Alphaproteobacteria bacterium]